jgi:hypothetical protein
MTKKHKPSRASLYGVTWFAEPTAKPNTVSVEARWEEIPLLWRADGAGKMAVPLHDKTNHDIARLLLKIGVELLSVHDRGLRSTRDYCTAKEVILGIDVNPWPYFVLRDRRCLKQLTSVFEAIQEAREYVQSLGFDLYLHEIQDEEILFFQYGEFVAATSITSRCADWTEIFDHWKVSYVGCPHEYSHLHG